MTNAVFRDNELVALNFDFTYTTSIVSGIFFRHILFHNAHIHSAYNQVCKNLELSYSVHNYVCKFIKSFS